MKILEINTECYFLINGRKVKPEELSKNDLLDLFNAIYQQEDVAIIQIPEADEIDNIKNPVEREIVNQIIQKIREFIDNLEQIKRDIESSFPTINAES